MREDQSAVTGKAAEPHALRGQLHGLPGPAGGVNGRALWCSAGLAPPHSAAGVLQTVPQALPGQAFSILCGRSSSTLGDTVGCLMASLLGSTKSSQHSGGSTNQLVSWCSELQPAEPVTRGCSGLPGTRLVRQGGLQPALWRWPGQLAQLCPDQLMQTSQCVLQLGLCVLPAAGCRAPGSQVSPCFYRVSATEQGGCFYHQQTACLGGAPWREGSCSGRPTLELATDRSRAHLSSPQRPVGPALRGRVLAGAADRAQHRPQGPAFPLPVPRPVSGGRPAPGSPSRQ